MPPPATFRSSVSPRLTKHRSGLQIVVARYTEDLSWLDQFSSLPSIVYDKGDSAGANGLPNVGRESHTYLHHICSCYENLAETTVFLQGYPFDHVPDLHDQLWDIDDSIGFHDLSRHILAEDSKGGPVHPGLGIGEMYAEVFGTPGRDYYTCHSGACFAVSKSNILQRPKSFYENALAAVVDREQGPWEIERLWQDIFRTRSTRKGVVTASDAPFFRNLQLLIRSQRQVTQFPVAIYDLGLEPSQRQWCLEQPGVALLKPPKLYEPYERLRNYHWWQTWIKPFLIFNAPFDQVLWIDADCTIVGALEKAFETIENQPLLVRDGTSAVTENHQDLYRYLPIGEDSATQGINLNAGVVGLCKRRDSDILQAWCFGVGWAALNPDKQRLSAWVDQGILLWACHHAKKTDSIQEDLRWNQPAKPVKSILRSAVRNNRSILDEIREQHPKVSIVHWLGPGKLAKYLADEIEQLFLDGF